MKIWKSIIRIWFTLASLGSFLLGWIVLAHAPKPNQFNPASLPSAPKMDPVPSLDQIMNGGQSQSFFRASPRRLVLRSGGS
jgi:hypothetical protein